MEQYINKIIHADCMDILKQLPDKCIDLVLTDPPYGMCYQSSWRTDKYKLIENDNNLDWLNDWLNEIKRIIKDDAMLYIFCSWHHIDEFKKQIENFIKVKNILIWNKNNFGSGDLYADYAPKYENIIFCNPRNKHLNGNRIPNVIDCAKTLNDLHPTQKPEKLFSLLINKSSNENDLILDCFSGSGTTAVACHNLNRRFICIEKDEDYYKASVERLENAKAQLKLF
jgi:site-specific DNA-methyltransferase (adenine-specific)